MTRKPSVCAQIEPDLIAVATGEGQAAMVARVDGHVRACEGCARELERYRAVEQVIGIWRAPPVDDALSRSRHRIEKGLGDLRRRLLVARAFGSPLGPILIARSEEGVSLIEYLDHTQTPPRSRLAQAAGMEIVEDGAEVEALYRDLLEFLEGKRTRLDWPLDLRLARSDFQRTVLRTAAAIPYGAVTSYAGLAGEVGKPSASRAVAQALRWNPLPIVVPCHRIVGADGALVGYAGNKVGLKQRLLGAEGVRTVEGLRGPHIDRRLMYVSYPPEPSYCLPSCGWLATLEQPQRLRYFGSPTRAEAAGLAPCTDCRPDLHPLSQ
ncbi:MAG: methylated-DNA--[protein]-cysteine S-methyltransferase [Candidatus Rokuibacteriota bacterium]